MYVYRMCHVNAACYRKEAEVDFVTKMSHWLVILRAQEDWPSTNQQVVKTDHNSAADCHILLKFGLSVRWLSGVVVSMLALINEVNLRRTRLVLIWVTVSGSIPGAGHLFQYVTNQPPKANSAFHPSGVGKWVPTSAGKAKAGMVHSDSGWTRGVQVKLWNPLRTRATPERLRGVFTTRRNTNPSLPLPLPISLRKWQNG